LGLRASGRAANISEDHSKVERPGTWSLELDDAGSQLIRQVRDFFAFFRSNLTGRALEI
jgi:hypothetical protein